MTLVVVTAGEDEGVPSTDKSLEKQRPASYFSPLLSGGESAELGREMVFHPVLSSGATSLEASKDICLAQREKTAFRMSVTE